MLNRLLIKEILVELTTSPVTPETLTGQVLKLKSDGYRFVTITCNELDADSMDLIYHFDKDLVLIHLRFQVKKGATVPSISPVFFASFLVENEIDDQFGLKFSDLVLDFGGSLYLENEVRTTPFCKYGIKESKHKEV